ncbi:hypothetical protein OS493_021676 [Desmophyllum pertusum]|uniref:F5/8 type C domain-containing protein n=1 Tax=Desmophyllum pertusum TaxID=174260 RepID=A0A9W9YB07_9CNID|nr:hypothetical protein OS493_021676 [Desmophyllum pertusum]
MQHLSWLITLELVLLSGSLVKGQKSCKDFAVGIKDKRIIPDTHMTASSSLSSQTRAYHARVKGKGEGWCAGENRQGEYLEITVGKEIRFVRYCLAERFLWVRDELHVAIFSRRTLV